MKFVPIVSLALFLSSPALAAPNGLRMHVGKQQLGFVPYSGQVRRKRMLPIA
jgi:hypothetical protein